MNRRILIIGPSGSGKTTVAEALARELRLPLFRLDDFRVRRRLYILHACRKVRTFEDPTLWNGYALACKLAAVAGGWIAEGNHLLHYAGIAALPGTERYYLDVPHRVSIARRRTRHRFLAADESFALIGEAETGRWVAPQKLLPGVRMLDGTLPPATSVAEILQLAHA